MTEDKHTAENLMSVVGEGETLPDDELLYDLADLFKTFGDTTRIKILYALMNGDLYVNDIAEIVGVSQSAVSHQLRVLKQARLVKFTRDGKNVTYSLADDHVYAMLSQGLTHICEKAHSTKEAPTKARKKQRSPKPPAKEGTTMKKSYKLENLGCANCAARMEDAINKIDGVTKAQVVFMTSKLKLETSTDNIDPILDEAQKIITSFEDDCVIAGR